MKIEFQAFFRKLLSKYTCHNPLFTAKQSKNKTELRSYTQLFFSRKAVSLGGSNMKKLPASFEGYWVGVNKKVKGMSITSGWIVTYNRHMIQARYCTIKLLHFLSLQQNFFPKSLVDLSKLKLCDQSETKQSSISGKNYSALKYLG